MRLPKQSQWEKRLASSAALKLKVKRLVAHGMSLEQVGKLVGVTKQRVGQIMKEFREESK